MLGFRIGVEMQKLEEATSEDYISLWVITNVLPNMLMIEFSMLSYTQNIVQPHRTTCLSGVCSWLQVLSYTIQIHVSDKKNDHIRSTDLKVDGSCMVTFPTGPLLLGYHTCNSYELVVSRSQAKVVAIFLMISGAHTNILLIIKVKTLMLIRRVIYIPPIMSTNEPRNNNHILRTHPIKHMSLWYPFLDPHLTYHSI